jgi:transposase
VARERVGHDPVEGGALFVFAAKSGTRIKLLWFDRNGLCLLYKRLHRAVFELPAAANGAVSIHIDGAVACRRRKRTKGTHSRLTDRSRYVFWHASP